MSKRFIKESAVLLLILSFFVFNGKEVSLAQEEPVIYAPEGLEEREQRALERRYRYGIRHKGRLAEPYITTPFAEEPTIAPIDARALTEEEKLYRYFGIASVLREAGRIEEAVEILKYIISERPNDEYVKKYLSKVQKELKQKKAKWLITSRKDANFLKKQKIKDFTEDGIAYYKQRRFDMSLSKFADVLTLDPDNAIAKRYMNKLKKYYSKEVRVENIVKEWETGEGITSQMGQTMTELLDEAELKEKGITPQIAQAIKERLDNAEYKEATPQREQAIGKMLDKIEMERTIENVKISSLLNQAELGLKIEEIIAQRREEEKGRYFYTLGPGDQLQISVQDHAELSGNVTVGPAGDIVLPLVNDVVMARDLTAGELQREVAKTLRKYVRDPIVYAGIIAYKSKVFYVIDEQSCTPYNIARADFTLRDALFMSDWGANRALGRVLVMKPGKLHPIVKKIDAFDIIYRGNLARNIRIENGDVIYVPLTAASKISTTIADALSPVKAVKDVRDEWLDQKWNRVSWTNLPRVPIDRTQESTWGGSSSN